MTATRSSEVRGMKWSEIDFEAATWAIPAARMKGNREFRIPLSRQAMNVLKAAKKVTPGGSYVFSLSGDCLWKGVFQDLLKKLEIKANPHGFRSSFADWAAERSGMPE